MALDYFVTKFYSFPPIEKEVLKKYKLADDIDKWIIDTILIPIGSTDNFLALIATNNLSIFDRIEDELSATEIDFSEFAKAARLVGTKYQMFYPSANITSLF